MNIYIYLAKNIHKSTFYFCPIFFIKKIRHPKSQDINLFLMLTKKGRNNNAKKGYLF